MSEYDFDPDDPYERELEECLASLRDCVVNGYRMPNGRFVEPQTDEIRWIARVERYMRETLEYKGDRQVAYYEVAFRLWRHYCRSSYPQRSQSPANRR
jgi:hypothetical protein